MSVDHRTSQNLKTRFWDWVHQHSGDEPAIGHQWDSGYDRPVRWELTTCTVLDNWLFGVQCERDQGRAPGVWDKEPRGAWPGRLWVTLGFGPFTISIMREWRIT